LAADSLGDSAAQKERISRAVKHYISGVDTVQSWVELARDVTKARSTLRQLTKETFLRWFCFALGVLPQAIKLFGSSGIMPLQICGAGFLFSWIIFEAMVVAARILGLEESDASWTLDWDYAPGQHELAPGLVLRIASGINRVLLRVLDVLVFPWSFFRSLWKEPRRERRKLKPKERLFGYWVSSIMLGCAGVLGHITSTIYLFQNEYLGKSVMTTFSLVLIPVWIDDLGSLMIGTRIEISESKRAENIIRFYIIPVSFLLSFKIAIWMVAVKREALVETQPLLIFVGVCVFCRFFAISSLSRSSARFHQHLLAGLRLMFCCVPSAYNFLVLYEEEGTELLTWAEWLG
jgi:hypothetical protein